MQHFAPQERTLCALQLLTNNLTSRERMLVAALTLGFTMVQIAVAWNTSVPAVSQMAKRVRLKAERYWQ